MKEADLFRQYAHEAALLSCKDASQDVKHALIALACIWAQAALVRQRGPGSSFIPSLLYPALRETHPVL
jgi:hypothetical protein